MQGKEISYTQGNQAISELVFYGDLGDELKNVGKRNLKRKSNTYNLDIMRQSAKIVSEYDQEIPQS